MATVWTQNGLSDRVWTFGDGVTFGDGLMFGDPVPVFNPNVNITTWTQVSPDPED